jgi:hypothetical protein
MLNIQNVKTSSVKENPSPEVDRGNASNPLFYSYYPLDGGDLVHTKCRYGQELVLKLKPRVNKHTDELYYQEHVCDPSVSTCASYRQYLSSPQYRNDISGDCLMEMSTNINHRLNCDKNVKYCEKHHFGKRANGTLYLQPIFEQGGPIDVNRMIRNAKTVQRLSDHNVGGGLGKKKRLNRLVAQGEETRYSGRKKKCPIRIEEELARTSSKAAQASSRNVERDNKRNCSNFADIQEQAFGFGLPQVPIGMSEDTGSLISEFVETIKNKKVDLSDDTLGALDELTKGAYSIANATVTHRVQFPQLPSSLTSPEMRVFWVGGLLLVTFAAVGNRKLLKALLSVTAIAVLWFPEWTSEARHYYDIVLEWAKERLKFYNSKCDTEVPLGTEQIQEQGFSGGVVDAIIGFMYFTAFRKCTLWKKDTGFRIQDFFHETSDMRKIKSGVEFTFSGLLSYIQVFLDWMSKKFGFARYDISMDGKPEVVLYSEKVTILLDAFAKGRVLNSDSAKDVMAIYSEGSKISKSLPISIEYQDVRKMMQVTMAELNPLVMKIRRSNLHNMGPRIQPIGIILTGPSGIGKTTALTPLMLAVTSNVLAEDQLEAFEKNHNDFIYNRISENEYYDSYNGQMNVTFDDFGQQVDVKGTPKNQYMEFIRMVNSNAMDLHMAHLDDKGLTNFRSKMVWATSNVNKFRLQSIVDTKAVARRFMCSYVVFPAPGFRADESETDVWKMALRSDIDPSVFEDHTFSHLVFMEYDCYEGKILNSDRLNMEQVIERVTTAYRFTQCMGQKILDTHESFKRVYLARRKGEDVLEEQGSQISKGIPGIFPNESMTSYVSRLSKLNKIEAAEKQFQFQRTQIVAELDVLAEAVASKTRLEQFISDYKEKMYTAWCTLHDVVDTNKCITLLKYVLTGLATFTAGYGLFKLFSPGGEELQSGPYSHQPKGGAPKPKAVKAFKSFVRKGKLTEQGLEEQACVDSTCDDIIYKVFKKNVYSMHVDEETPRMGCITFLGGQDAFMPRHFAENIFSKIEDGVLPDDYCVILRSVSNPEVFFEIAWSEITWFFPDDWEDEDVVFARFPNTLPQAPDIRKYIMGEPNQVDQLFTGKFMDVKPNGTLTVYSTAMMPLKDLTYTNYVCPIGYEYDIATKTGDCGSLVFVSNPLTGSEKILGFHVAGAPRSGKGFSSRMSKELISAYDRCSAVVSNPVREEQVFEPKFTRDFIEPQSFKSLFKARKARPPSTTSIVPSPMHATFFKPLCAPAAMRPFVGKDGSLVDPWVNARQNYAKPVLFLDQQTLEQCASSYWSGVISRSSDDVPWKQGRVFTFEEAVAGVPGVPHCDGIPRNTSSGWPHNLDIPKGYRYKQHFFGKEGDYDFSSKECQDLKARVSNIIAHAVNGNRLLHVYLDFLKDERRKKSKAEQGLTRLVSCCPVDLSIVIRMYFLDFMRWFMHNRLSNGSAVGINVFSSEWVALRKIMRGSSVINNMIAGDFKSFDGCQTRQLHMIFLKYVNRWYNDGNDLIRTVLFEEICNSKHIYKDLVYEWASGNPSGNPLTTILNTFNNNVILRYASLLAYDEFTYGPDFRIVSVERDRAVLLKQIENCVNFMAYGDDNLITVGEPFREWLNQHSLSRAFPKMGFTYTSEAKNDDEVPPLRSIDDVTFLKRSWKFDPIPATYVAALDLDTVLEMCQWTTVNDKNFNDVRTNVDNTLKELSAHGEEVWDRWSSNVIRFSVEKLNYSPPIPNRRNAISQQLSRTDYSC